MNKIIISGNIAKEVEFREYENGNNLAKFSVAVRRPHSKTETDFFDIVVWGKLANICEKRLVKGNKVCIAGFLTTNSYTTQSGQKRLSYSIQADDVEFLTPLQNEQTKDIPF